MTLQTFPVGNVVTCRFAFTLRPLTVIEAENFQGGLGLPSGTGSDPPTVSFDYQPPDLPTVTFTGGQVVRDAVGAYHANVPVTAPGQWRWRGYGQDGSGSPIACTIDQMFIATRSF